MTSAIIRSRAAERAPRKSVYLVNPFFDYTFVCGGLALALSAIALSAQIPANTLVQSSTPVILLGVLGTYLFSEPHSAATLFRLYGEASNRKRFAFVAYGLPLILAACFIGALYVPMIAKIMAVLYLIFITHHIMAQSFGIAMLYCARDGFIMSRADKNGMKALIYSAVTLSVAQQFTTAWQREHFLGIAMPPMGFLPPQLINMLQTMVILTFKKNQTHSTAGGGYAIDRQPRPLDQSLDQRGRLAVHPGLLSRQPVYVRSLCLQAETRSRAERSKKKECERKSNRQLFRNKRSPGGAR
jgi:hypothetical protein